MAPKPREPITINCALCSPADRTMAEPGLVSMCKKALYDSFASFASFMYFWPSFLPKIMLSSITRVISSTMIGGDSMANPTAGEEYTGSMTWMNKTRSLSAFKFSKYQENAISQFELASIGISTFRCGITSAGLLADMAPALVRSSCSRATAMVWFQSSRSPDKNGWESEGQAFHWPGDGRLSQSTFTP